MGDGKSDGEVRLCVCVVSLTSPPIQTKRGICVQCVYLFCLTKKKEKLKENGKVHSHSALSSLAVYAVILLTV